MRVILNFASSGKNVSITFYLYIMMPLSMSRLVQSSTHAFLTLTHALFHQTDALQYEYALASQLDQTKQSRSIKPAQSSRARVLTF